MSETRRRPPPSRHPRRSIGISTLALLVVACTHPASTQGNGNERGPGAPSRPSVASGEFEERPGEHRHLILRYSPDGLALLESTTVGLPLPQLRTEPKGSWRVVVESEQGEVLYETRFPPPTRIRGEFANDEGKLTSVTVLQEDVTFGVRLPTTPDASKIRVFAPVHTLEGGHLRDVRMHAESVDTELEIGVLDADGAVR